MTRQITFGLIALACVAMIGCGGRPKLAEVEGQVLIDGEPVEGIEIKYIPDPESGNEGRFSTGKTNAEGKFTLVYDDEDKLPGASIGQCRILVRDLLPAYTSRDAEPQPSRIALKYSEANTTPLRQTVESGIVNNHVFKFSSDEVEEERAANANKE